MLDYFIKDLNVAIEYNGDYWHGNPKFYKPDDDIKFLGGKIVKAKDLWEKDKKRYDYLESIGIKTIVIWEHDAKTLDVEKFLKQHKLI